MPNEGKPAAEPRSNVDSVQIVKEYSSPVREERRKYSPAQLVSVYKTAMNGDPVPSLASTSMIERANLTVRTHCKRLARLTLSFSKKKRELPSCHRASSGVLQFREIPRRPAHDSHDGGRR